MHCQLEKASSMEKTLVAAAKLQKKPKTYKVRAANVFTSFTGCMPVFEELSSRFEEGIMKLLHLSFVCRTLLLT